MAHVIGSAAIRRERRAPAGVRSAVPRPASATPAPGDPVLSLPADALAPLLARAVRRRHEALSAPRMLQRYRVPNMPTMKSQLGHASIIPPFFVDLNCGWYCQVAAIRQRAAQLQLQLPAIDQLLPKTTRLAFDPGFHGADLATEIDTPGDINAWRAALQAHGPIIVSGKLGAADWGILRGVGHFILIVGAHRRTNRLDYLDPLQGNSLRSGDHDHMAKRMEDTAYHVDDAGLQSKVQQLAQVAQV